MIHAKRGATGDGTPFINDGLLGGETEITLAHSPPNLQALNWRDHLKVHPAADLFPLMSEPELKELGEDIKKNGLKERIWLWAEGEPRDDYSPYLVDGRNRLDAMERAGLEVIDGNGQLKPELYCVAFGCRHGPYDAVISLNIHRRHLTAEQKREIVAGLLKAKPEASDRSIAKLAKTSPTTVGAVRSTVQSGQLEKRIGADGRARKQPARLKHTDPNCWDCGGNGYFRGGDSGRCHCHGVSPAPVSTAPEKLSSGLPTGSDSSELVPCSPAERRAAKKYEQEQDEIMRVEAERLVEKLIKTDIESARSLYRILDSANFPALIFTLRDALEREFDGEDDGLNIPDLKRAAPP
jgi:hypothetical protein